MRKIVDASFLRTPELETYLQDKNNTAIFCEFSCMECYKGDPVKTLSSSTEIAAKYPKQVLVLRSNKELAIRTLKKYNINHLIDWEQSEGFRDFCGQVKSCLMGNAALQSAVRRHSKAAKEHFELTERDASKVAEAIQMFTKEFSLEDLRTIRSGKEFGPALINDTIKNIKIMTILLLERHPNLRTIPPRINFQRAYLFRYAAAGYALALDWIKNGGIENFPLHKLKNDIIDMNYVASATFFDGLLSCDQRMNRIYTRTKELLAYSK